MEGTLTVEVTRFSSTLATMSSRALVSSASFFFRACNCSFSLLFLCIYMGRERCVEHNCLLVHLNTKRGEKCAYGDYFVSVQAGD